MMQHDTGSRRLAIRRGPNGVWRLVEPGSPLAEQAPPPQGLADRGTPSGIGDSGK
jgi:hypothetical protein